MISVTTENFRDGMRVVRGKDWKWGNQDQTGSGNGVGVIIENKSNPYIQERWVEVTWHLDGRRESDYCYRMGAEGCYDLYIYDEAEFLTLDGKPRK